MSTIDRTRRFDTENNFPPPERFELDGRLLVPDTGEAGRFHTKIESFSRIRRISADDSWEITKPNGVVLRYGLTVNAKLVSTEFSPPLPAWVAQWLLSEMEDPHGNVIKFTYLREPTEHSPNGGFAYLSEVSYTHRGAARTPVGELRRIVFVYDERPDELLLFSLGLKQNVSKRLTEIQVLTGTEVFQRRVLQYDGTAYSGSYSTRRSRLAWTQLFGSDCPLSVEDPTSSSHGCTGLPKEEYRYTDPIDILPQTVSSQWIDASGWEVPSDISFETGSGSGKDMGVRIADLNGDGRLDLVKAYEPDGGAIQYRVYLNSGTGWEASVAWQNALAVPAIQSSLVTAQSSGNNVCNITTASDPNQTHVAFAGDRSWSTPLSSPVNTYRPPPSWDIEDLNEDGRADLFISIRVGHLVARKNCSGGTLSQPNSITGTEVRAVFLNTGTGWQFDATRSLELPVLATLEVLNLDIDGSEEPESCSGNACLHFIDHHPAFVDVNGDSLTDVVALRVRYPPEINGDTYDFSALSNVWMWTDLGWASSDLILPPGGTNYYPAILAAHWNLWREKPNSQYWNADVPVIDQDAGVRFADMNNDGLVDLIHARGVFDGTGYTPRMSVYLNTLDPFAWTWCIFPTSGAWCPEAERFISDDAFFIADASLPTVQNRIPPVVTRPTEIIDINGDGLLDIVAHEKPGEILGRKTWIHDPGRFGNVWNYDDESPFRPSPAMAGISLHDPHRPYRSRGVRVFDVNGDGAPDFLRARNSERFAKVSRSGLNDRLREHKDGWSGRVDTISYAGAARQQSPALETKAGAVAATLDEDDGVSSWSSKSVVSEWEVSGPGLLAGSHRTTFMYARPRQSIENRTHLGFAASALTRPDLSVVESYRYQGFGRSGQLFRRDTMSQGGSVLRRESTEWEIVPGQSVTGSAQGVIVARPVGQSSTNLYGSSDQGAVATTSIDYDDSYGFNFANARTETRPSGIRLTELIPKAKDLSRWIVGLVEEARERDGISEALLAHSIFEYEASGALTSKTDLATAQGSEVGPVVDHLLFVDEFGNSVRSVDNHGHSSSVCYDGDAVYAGTSIPCPSMSSGASHSVVTGVLDPLATDPNPRPGETHFEVDPVLGLVVARVDPNGDATLLVRDPFGRVEQQYFSPAHPSAGDPSGDILLASRAYHAAGSATPEASLEIFNYVTGTTSIRTAQYFDALGGSLRTVAEVAPATVGGARRYVGTLTFSDPRIRRTTSTLEAACSNSHCSNLSLATAGSLTSMTETRDELGRSTRVDSPDGISLSSYSSGLGPGGPTQSYDVVLSKNVRGNLIRRTMDADRLIWMDECANSLSAEATSIGSAECGAHDRTQYSYVPTGEISTIHDAVATATGNLTNRNHRISYRYDTLGRVTEISDPDKVATPAGWTNLFSYDDANNARVETNARGQSIVFHLDALHRPTFIERPSGERSATIVYDDDFVSDGTGTRARREIHESGFGGHTQRFGYDGFGNLRSDELTVSNTTSRLDFRYDRLGRVTRVVYPIVDTVVAYEYAGTALTRICEVATESAPCGAPSGDYISSVSYDSLGRPESMVGPYGNHQIGYDPIHRRVTSSTVAPSIGGPPLVDLEYGYEHGVLNSRVDSGNEPNAGFRSTAMFDYDKRDRLRVWIPDASQAAWGGFFTYDSIGNLTGLAVGAEGQTNRVYDDPARPHALKTIALSPGYQVSYDYDADGNMTRRQTTGETSWWGASYDSSNRLKCFGEYGSCYQLSVSYDVDGQRIRQSTSNAPETLFHSSLVEVQPNAPTGVWTKIYVEAFGRQIAFKVVKNATLRSGSSLGFRIQELLAPLQGPVIPPLLAVAVLLAILEARRRARVPIAPAWSSLSLLLAYLIAVPSTVSAGGGGPGGAPVYRRWIFTDQVGSALVVATENGVQAERHAFSPFGGKIGGTNQEQTPSVFAGHPQDNPMYVTYMGARWYDHLSGRFLSIDPIVGSLGNPQSHNPYTYANNNPVMYSDPTGLITEGGPPPRSREIFLGTQLPEPPGFPPLPGAQWDGKHWLHIEISVESGTGQDGMLPPESSGDVGTCAAFGAEPSCSAGSQGGFGLADAAELGIGVFVPFGGTAVALYHGDLGGAFREAGIDTGALVLGALTGGAGYFAVKGLKAVRAARAARSLARFSDETASLTAGQAKNLARFNRRFSRGGSGTSVDRIGDQVLFTKTIRGDIPGSSKVYQKSVDPHGATTSYLKTTFDPQGGIPHVKDALQDDLIIFSDF